MANEYKIHTLWTEVASDPLDDVRIFSLHTELVYAPLDPFRLYGLWVEVISTTDTVWQPDYIPDDDDIGGVVWVNDVVWSPDPIPEDEDGPTTVQWQTDAPLPYEWNPYRPDVPIQIAENDKDTYEYLREQSELVRFQHNITQAGDTTFPWQMIATPSDTAQFTLGSLSRFRHKAFGLLHARYCKFSDSYIPAVHPFVGHDSQEFDWTVTDKATRTASYRVVGIAAPYKDDLANQFGWVMVHGRSIFGIFLSSDSEPIPGTRFTWDLDNIGRVTTAAGPSVGYVVDPVYKEVLTTGGDSYDPKLWVLPAGSWFIQIEGVTDAYLEELSQEGLDALEDRVSELEQASGSDPVDLTQIESDINQLQAAIQQESVTRSAVDSAQAAQIEALALEVGGPTDTEFLILENRVVVLETDLAALTVTENTHYNALGARIDLLVAFDSLIGARVDSLELALGMLNGVVMASSGVTPGIYGDASHVAQITVDERGRVLDAVNVGISSVAGGGILPVVDGSIPPTFIQNPDGSLVYVEVL